MGKKKSKIEELIEAVKQETINELSKKKSKNPEHQLKILQQEYKTNMNFKKDEVEALALVVKDTKKDLDTARKEIRNLRSNLDKKIKMIDNFLNNFIKEFEKLKKKV